MRAVIIVRACVWLGTWGALGPAASALRVLPTNSSNGVVEGGIHPSPPVAVYYGPQTGFSVVGEAILVGQDEVCRSVVLEASEVSGCAPLSSVIPARRHSQMAARCPWSLAAWPAPTNPSGPRLSFFLSFSFAARISGLATTAGL